MIRKVVVIAAGIRPLRVQRVVSSLVQMECHATQMKLARFELPKHRGVRERLLWNSDVSKQ